MIQLEIGEVTVYFRKEKRGKIALSTGEIIFFYFEDGSLIEAGEKTPVFTNKQEGQFGEKKVTLFIPNAGEKIVFVRFRDPYLDKYRAAPWGYAKYWFSALEYIKTRNEPKAIQNENSKEES